MKFSGILCLLLPASFICSMPMAAAQAKGDKTKLTTTKKDDRPSPPRVAEGSAGTVGIRIEYSAPAVKGRKVWGDLVPYGRIWRTGANEATTVEISRDCKMGGSRLEAGKYALFTIPGETEWTIIFNRVPDQWGAFKYDESKDALRFTVKPQKSEQFNERLLFTIYSRPDQSGAITLQWEDLALSWEVR